MCLLVSSIKTKIESHSDLTKIIAVATFQCGMGTNVTVRNCLFFHEFRKKKKRKKGFLFFSVDCQQRTTTSNNDLVHIDLCHSTIVKQRPNLRLLIKRICNKVIDIVVDCRAHLFIMVDGCCNSICF